MLVWIGRRPVSAGRVLAAITTGVVAVAVPLPASASSPAAPRTRVVTPGQSIQAAIDTASPGDRIVVRGGTYAEQLTITTDGIELVGRGAVLVPPARFEDNICTGFSGPGTEAGVCVSGRDVVLADFVAEHRKVQSVGRRVRGVEITGFEVRGFAGADVALVGAADAVISSNRLVEGSKYGAVTAGSKNTRYTDNRVVGGDSHPFIAMCVDDASPALVARNHVSGYDVAFCVQTHGARVLHNHVEHTCIGTYVDPGITGAMVKGNVYGPTNPACGVAPGFGAYGTYGIILDGSIGATVTRNRIVGQHSAAGAVGLAVRSQASGNVVKGNVLRGNDLDLDAADAGPGNTIVRNRCATSVPDGLCG